MRSLIEDVSSGCSLTVKLVRPVPVGGIGGRRVGRRKSSDLEIADGRESAVGPAGSGGRASVVPSSDLHVGHRAATAASASECRGRASTVVSTTSISTKHSDRRSYSQRLLNGNKNDNEVFSEASLLIGNCTELLQISTFIWNCATIVFVSMSLQITLSSHSTSQV